MRAQAVLVGLLRFSHMPGPTGRARHAIHQRWRGEQHVEGRAAQRIVVGEGERHRARRADTDRSRREVDGDGDRRGGTHGEALLGLRRGLGLLLALTLCGGDRGSLLGLLTCLFLSLLARPIAGFLRRARRAEQTRDSADEAQRREGGSRAAEAHR